MWHWKERPTLWFWNLLKPNKKEPWRIISFRPENCPSLETESRNYIYLKENIPKSFSLLVFLVLFTCFCLLFCLTLFPKVITQLSTSLPVLRIWYLIFDSMVQRNCITWEGEIRLSLSHHPLGGEFSCVFQMRQNEIHFPLFLLKEGGHGLAPGGLRIFLLWRELKHRSSKI